jgi:integrase
LNALVFLYKHVLNQELGEIGGVVRSKRPKRLPVVFSREEAVEVLKQLNGQNLLMANLLYGAGLRLMECQA